MTCQCSFSHLSLYIHVRFGSPPSKRLYDEQESVFCSYTFILSQRGCCLLAVCVQLSFSLSSSLSPLPVSLSLLLPSLTLSLSLLHPLPPPSLLSHSLCVELYLSPAAGLWGCVCEQPPLWGRGLLLLSDWVPAAGNQHTDLPQRQHPLLERHGAAVPW